MQRDNIVLIGGTNGELIDFTNRMSTPSKGVWNGNRHRKNTIETNSTIDITVNISMKGQKLEVAANLKCTWVQFCARMTPAQQNNNINDNSNNENL